MGKRIRFNMGSGWGERKVFCLPEKYADREITLDFDGVSAPCRIEFNGVVLKRQFAAGVPFTVDITDLARYGEEENTLSVCRGLEETEHTSANDVVCGDVWLEAREIVNIAKYGVFIKPEQIGPLDWNIHIETTISNMHEGDVEVKIVTRFTDPDEEMELAVEAEDVACEAGSETTIAQDVEFHAPKLWDIEYPNVYSVVTELYIGERLVDTDETVCGFRTVAFDDRQGCILNGRKIKIYGVPGERGFLQETDVLPESMCKYMVAGWKEYGVNTYWCVDGCAPEGILAACDKYGILVIDGAKTLGTSQEEMEEMQTTVLRDRNHPAVCMYALCRENAYAGTRQTERMERRLVRMIEELDDSRETTVGAACAFLQDIEAEDLPQAETGGFVRADEEWYLVKAFSDTKPFCHIKPHWNLSGKEAEKVEVTTYTNCQEAELFVNKKSYGRRAVGGQGKLLWEVEYEAGVLEVVGYREGLKCVHDVRITTGEPSRIKITPWRGKMYGDGRDVIPFAITAVDENGYQVPDAVFTPEVHVNGGTLLKLQKNPEGYQAVIRSEAGKNQLMITASAEGLSIGNVMIPLLKRRRISFL